MTINRLNQGVTNQVLVKAVSGQTTPLLELQDSSGNVVSSIGPTGALGGTLGDSGLVHINTTSFSNVASQSINNVFSSTYENYLIKITGTVATSEGAVALRLRASGTDAATNYNTQQLFVGGATVSASGATGQTSGIFGYFDDGTQNAYDIFIYKPFETIETIFRSIGVSSALSVQINERTGRHTTAASYDGFTIIPTTNITGSVSVYGFRD